MKHSLWDAAPTECIMSCLDRVTGHVADMLLFSMQRNTLESILPNVLQCERLGRTLLDTE